MPAQMTYPEFRKAHPAVRHFTRYTSEQRANHASSHLLTKAEQIAIGKPFYTHPMCRQDAGYDSAKAATLDAYKIYCTR